MGPHFLQVDQWEQVWLLFANLVLNLLRGHLHQLFAHDTLFIDVALVWIAHPQLDLLLAASFVGQLDDRLGIRLGIFDSRHRVNHS